MNPKTVITLGKPLSDTASSIIGKTTFVVSTAVFPYRVAMPGMLQWAKDFCKEFASQLFIFNLVLDTLMMLADTMEFIFEDNKNLERTASLAYSYLKMGLVLLTTFGAAIIGGAAATILICLMMGMDTLILFCKTAGSAFMMFMSDDPESQNYWYASVKKNAAACMLGGALTCAIFCIAHFASPVVGSILAGCTMLAIAGKFLKARAATIWNHGQKLWNKFKAWISDEPGKRASFNQGKKLLAFATTCQPDTHANHANVVQPPQKLNLLTNYFENTVMPIDNTQLTADIRKHIASMNNALESNSLIDYFQRNKRESKRDALVFLQDAIRIWSALNKNERTSQIKFGELTISFDNETKFLPCNHTGGNNQIDKPICEKNIPRCVSILFQVRKGEHRIII